MGDIAVGITMNLLRTADGYMKDENRIDGEGIHLQI